MLFVYKRFELESEKPHSPDNYINAGALNCKDNDESAQAVLQHFARDFQKLLSSKNEKGGNILVHHSKIFFLIIGL
jgi:hypothetical protein